MEPNQQNQKDLSAYLDEMVGPSYAPPLKPQKKSTKKWFLLAGGLLAVLVAVVIVLALTNSDNENSSTASQLAFSTQDGVVFSYPQTWKELDVSESGYIIGYGNGSSIKDSTFLLYYKTADLFSEKVAIDSLTPREVEENQEQLVVSTRNMIENLPGEGACKEVSDVKVDPVKSADYFGVDFEYVCKENKSKNKTVYSLDRILYVGDGKMYQVSYVVDGGLYEKQQALIRDLRSSVLPRIEQE